MRAERNGGSSEFVENLQLGFDRLHVLVVDVGLGLEGGVRTTTAVVEGSCPFIAHKQLIPLDALLELLHLSVEDGQLILLLRTRFSFNAPELIFIQDAIGGFRLLSFGILHVFVSNF